MRVTAESLKEQYDSMTTEALVRLRHSGDLTPLASTVLQDILKNRGVTDNEVAPARNPYDEPKSNLIPRDHRTSMRRLFRMFVVGNTFLFLFWFFVLPYLENPFLSSATMDFLALAGLGNLVPFDYWLSYLISFCWVALFIGLYYFQRWSRRAMLWLTVIGLLLGPFWGLSVSTALSSTVAGLIGMLDGVILAMCYFSSVAGEFE